jgi:hypothetical protein
MARNQNAKQINFIPAEDIADRLGECDNKTKIINEALRMYFDSFPKKNDLAQRIEQLEDFQRCFLSYFARKDNEPHSEFCACDICKSNRRAFAPVIPLDPPAETFEKVLSIIERAIDQARRTNATVIFENRAGYKFRITANSKTDDEYARYLEDAQSRNGNGITVSIPNPSL